ncbi:MAG: hypothetical protein M1815_000494 [Lichina confinis]|nr:MAG: hypothetical protein M1815_000494 [Lichina confinis]
MSLLPRFLKALGALLLAHACYSAQEHSSLSRSSVIDHGPSSAPHASPSGSPASSSAPITATSNASLPADIVVETLVSVLIICIGLVLGSPALRPISWRVWAGSLENKTRKNGQRADGVDDAAGKAPMFNPFATLDSRVGFWDIRAKRKEFDDWARQSGTTGKT